jgi:hypothetical protein
MRGVWILLICFCWTACEKAVNIPVPYAGDRIVVNTLMQPDSLLYLRITRSQPPGSSVFPEIPDAKVTLKAGSTVVPVQWQVIAGKGYFVSQSPVRQDHRYTLEVSAAGLDTVHATDTLPRAPVLSAPFAQAGGSRVRFSMRDLPGADYYRFRLFHANKDYVPQKRALFRFDPSYNNNFTDLVSNNFLEYTLINDERFEGKEIVVVMQTQEVNKAGGYLLLEVTGLTSAAWQYLKTLEVQVANGGNPLTGPDAVYTNVSKGYGIMAGVNSAWLRVEIK